MELKEMTVEQLEERKNAIVAELDNEGADLDALEAEVRSIKEELETRANEEAQKVEIRKTVADIKAPVVVEKVDEEKREMKTVEEIRASKEYALAYFRAIVKSDDTEVRSLLSLNASSGGQIPVPEMLDDEIRTAWEENKVLGLVKQTYFKGNVKVAFELSATGASVHLEGATKPDEEVLTLGLVELKADNIKKWITVSDEAIEGTTIDTVGYLYRELAQRIAEKAEEVLIGIIDTAPQTSTASAAAVGLLKYGIDQSTILQAVSLLSASAKNLNIVMNRQTYALFANVALTANYAIDVFDGLKDRIVFSAALPGYADASEDDTYAIIGDFGYGAQANFPNGAGVTIKYDDLSLAEYDLVKLIGKQYVGMGVVAPNAFVKLTVPAGA